MAIARDRAPAPKKLSLALQGGGAHGAFTWGVIDRLLEDGRISIAGITGTSAGAMNAVVLAHGLIGGEPQAAREALTQFWKDVSRDGRSSPLQRSIMDRLMGNWSLANNPAYLAMAVLALLGALCAWPRTDRKTEINTDGLSASGVES